MSTFPVIGTSATTEHECPLCHVRQHADGARNGCCDSPDQNVPMLDMRQLVSNHTTQLVLRQHSEDSRTYCNRRMVRITASRKCVRLSRGDDIDLRHRKPGAL